MSTFQFIPGTEFVLNGVRFQILSIIDETFQIQDQSSGRIKEISRHDALTNFADGNLIPVAPKFIIGKKMGEVYKVEAMLDDLSDQEQKELRIRISFVKRAMSQNVQLTHHAIGTFLDTYWDTEEMGMMPSTSTAYRWLRAYQKSNSNPFSLLPKTHQCGNRILRLDGMVLDICNTVIRELYLTDKKKSMKSTYREIVASIARENKQLVPSQRLTQPSYKKVRSMIKSLNQYEVMKAREGKHAADLYFRNVTGSLECDHLNAIWQIDHTPLDVYAIDDDFGVLLQRPTLTTVFEKTTKSIMAAHLSFETCSTTRVAQALKQAIMPKTDLSHISPNENLDWYCHGLPELIIYDQGKEFTGMGTGALLHSLGIDAIQAAMGKGNLKGGVERVAGLLNKMVTEDLPGKTFASVGEKPFGYNPKKYASAPLSVIREKLYRCIDLYHSKKHDALNMSPKAKWKELEKVQQIRLPSSPDLIDAQIGQMAKRTLSHTGIEFMNMYYNSKPLNDYFKKHGKHKVNIRYNPEDLGQIIVMAKDNGYFKVPVNTIWSSYANSLGITAHKYIRDQLRKLNIDLSEEEYAVKESEIRMDVETKIKESNKQQKRIARARTKAPGNSISKDQPSANDHTKEVTSAASYFSLMEDEEIPTLEVA